MLKSYWQKLFSRSKKPRGGYSTQILLGLLLIGSSCKKNDTLFIQIDEADTGIDFVNNLTETENQNILAYEYFYNGGGVAAADFDNDGLTDLYFTGNQVENKLYKNKGNLQFEDLTQTAGVAGRQGPAWKTGVSIADVNGDGRLDIYVCYSGNLPPEKRGNELYINDGGMKFREVAAEYGLADTGYSTQAAWLDYDHDGDLDCFLINHNLRNYERKEAATMREEIDENAGDKLFKSNLTETGVPTFTEVTTEAGIKKNPMGFGLGLAVGDVNNDGWPDIFVGNDYVEDDYLYINQKNGHFKEVAREAFRHTSRFSMGCDLADVNNDGQLDLLTLDMLPEDNFRQKKLIFPDNWNTYQAELANGFGHQNMRNMLFLGDRQSKDMPTFQEIGQLMGISNTDWSWAGLLADFDNDGLKDIFVSNGLVKDYTDADFIKYYADAQMRENEGQVRKGLLEHLKQMPSSQTHHYIFKNKGDLTFENKVTDWGFDEPTVASGAVYTDLDNDGDLEIVTNNANTLAKIYKNRAQEKQKTNYLKIQLVGKKPNAFGIGARVVVRGKHRQYIFENNNTRGFQSAMVEPILVGLGAETRVSVEVYWPSGKKLVLNEIDVLKTHTLTMKETDTHEQANRLLLPEKVLLAEQSVTDFGRIEPNINDFNGQVLLPQHYSYAGGRMAVADVNKDGLPDVYVCGGAEQGGILLLQEKLGKFTKKVQPNFEKDIPHDAVFADLDADGDEDLYVMNGHYSLQAPPDNIYWNDGKGNFEKNAQTFDNENSSVVKVIDLNHDALPDLWVGGHVKPNQFPKAELSFCLLNKGNKTMQRININEMGMVTDAVVVDIDKDGYSDVLAIGEWEGISVLKNEKGVLKKNKEYAGLENLKGLWNRIEASDLDNDGDVDLVLGNIGLNTQIRASVKEPLELWAGDFDGNGTTDPYMSYYIQGKAYPAIGRDEALEQVVSLRKKYTNYQKWANATIEEMFNSDELAQGRSFQVNTLQTGILENTSKGFVWQALPVEAQFAPIYAIQVADVNNDGKKDMILAGNNSKFRMRIGKTDANEGLILLQTKQLTFQYGGKLNLKGDIKDVKKIGNAYWFLPCEGKIQGYNHKP